jgi:hypothetical protein
VRQRLQQSALFSPETLCYPQEVRGDNGGLAKEEKEWKKGGLPIMLQRWKVSKDACTFVVLKGKTYHD